MTNSTSYSAKTPAQSLKVRKAARAVFKARMERKAKAHRKTEKKS